MDENTREGFIGMAGIVYGRQYGRELIESLAAVVFDAFGGGRLNLRQVATLARWCIERSAGDKGGRAPRFQLSPADQLRASRRAEWATPWTERIRRALFDAPSPPFSDEAKATAWLKRESRAFVGQAARQVKKLGRWKRHADKTSRGLGAYGAVGSVEVRHETIPTFERGKPSAIPANSPTLHRLARETTRLAAATGWGQAQAVQWVLLGTQPMTPGIVVTPRLRSASAPTGEALAEEWATVDLYDTTIGLPHLQRVMTQLRELGWRKRKPITGKVAELDAFVRARRPSVPWKQVLEEWNRSHPKKEQHYETPRGMQLALQRARKAGGLQQARQAAHSPSNATRSAASRETPVRDGPRQKAVGRARVR
ncbi:MAG: hypothetical protein HY278_08945 [candidate division NC10 bacterium]|nr:hypothetical protein [candidate division NC10 bacterium]